MQNRFVIFLILVLIIQSCQDKTLTATEIIDKSVAAYGGERVFNSIISFDFRDKHYVAKYQNQRFSLKRIFSDSTGQIIDELTNDGFVRWRNDSLVTLDDEWRGKYSSSVNSVIYFFRIPFVLKDPAVRPELLGETEINGKLYYKIRISFAEEGGGEDFEDNFIYWMNKESFLIDYLAYSYSTDGGGKRFRQAINPRKVNGLHVVDYINFKPQDLAVPIEDYLTYFMKGGLVELSRIENRNVSVVYLTK